MTSSNIYIVIYYNERIIFKSKNFAATRSFLIFVSFLIADLI